MSGKARIAALVALVAAAAAAFVVLKPGDDGPPPKPPERPDVPGPGPVTTPAIRVVRKAIAVGADGPVGGVAEVRAKAGNRVVITVRSTGFEGEVHLHGFDISRDVAPGKPAVFDIPASATKQPAGQGSFELELEQIGVQVAQLLISP